MPHFLVMYYGEYRNPSAKLPKAEEYIMNNEYRLNEKVCKMYEEKNRDLMRSLVGKNSKEPNDSFSDLDIWDC